MTTLKYWCARTILFRGRGIHTLVWVLLIFLSSCLRVLHAQLWLFSYRESLHWFCLRSVDDCILSYPCFYQPGWCLKIWSTSCHQTIGLRRRWSFAVVDPPSPITTPLPNNPNPLDMFSFFFCNCYTSRYPSLRVCRFYTSGQFGRSLRIWKLPVVLNFSSFLILFSVLYWLYISAPRHICSARASNTCDTPLPALVSPFLF